MKTVQFELTSPFKYANGSGADIECNHIELREPTGRVSSTCMAIEGMVQSAILKTSGLLDDDTIEKAKEQAASQNRSDEPLDTESILALMLAGDIDMEKLTLHFRELFKVVAWMGGEKQITAARLDDMSHRDMRKMIGVYTANFIMS